MNVVSLQRAETSDRENAQETHEAPVNKNLLQSLQRKIEFQYQREILTQLPAKVTASNWQVRGF